MARGSDEHLRTILLILPGSRGRVSIQVGANGQPTATTTVVGSNSGGAISVNTSSPHQSRPRELHHNQAHGPQPDPTKSVRQERFLARPPQGRHLG
jgi:hypothetical protein